MRYRPLQIFAILFLLSFGAYFLRFLGGIGGDVPLRSTDPLKGAASAAELNDRIGKELAVANETGILAKDRQRLWIFLAGPPLAALISITACVGFFVKKRRQPEGSEPSFSRRSARLVCATCLVFSLMLFLVELSGHTFLSIPLVNLFGNPNTKPSLILPGEAAQVRIEYSPGVNSIQQRHSFKSVTISNLTYKPASGQSGVVELRGPATGASGESSFEGSSFSRALPEIRINDIYIELLLPDEPVLLGSLVTGDVRATVQYPVWASLDRAATTTSTIAGHVSFWVADKRQAEFAVSAQEFRDWEPIRTAGGDPSPLLILSAFAILVAIVTVGTLAAPRRRSR